MRKPRNSNGDCNDGQCDDEGEGDGRGGDFVPFSNYHPGPSEKEREVDSDYFPNTVFVGKKEHNCDNKRVLVLLLRTFILCVFSMYGRITLL